MGMTINNCWKLFRYGVKREHIEKLIGIRELSERLAQDCFNNNFSHNIGNPENNISPWMRLMMDIQFLLAVHLIFLVIFPPSASASTIFDITLNSASSISI